MMNTAGLLGLRTFRNPLTRFDSRSIPRLIFIAGLGVSVVSMLLLFQTSGVTSKGYDIQSLESQRDNLLRLNYQLDADIAKLESLDRVDREAKSKLKMVTPTSYVYVSVPVPSPDVRPMDDPNITSASGMAVEVRPANGASAFFSWLASFSESAGIVTR